MNNRQLIRDEGYFFSGLDGFAGGFAIRVYFSPFCVLLIRSLGDCLSPDIIDLLANFTFFKDMHKVSLIHRLRRRLRRHL